MKIDKKWFLKKANDFLRNNEANRMTGVDGSLFWEPDILLGFVSGDDPIFEKYKEVVGPKHHTPAEAYSIYCKKNGISANTDNLSVVAYILPMNPLTKKENLEYSKEWPSERWAHTRLYGDRCNKALQAYLLEELEKEGINGVAPMSPKGVKISDSPSNNYLFKVYNYVYSSWSHRHFCFAAGLGSFGLSDGFINETGKAMRCGSIIVDYKLPSDAANRPPDTEPYKYCLRCGECIKRCPVDAISFKGGHDKVKCREKITTTIPYINQNYHIPIYSCGLCQVGVPCSNGIPIKK